MSKIKRVMEAILVFLTGVLFTYFTYPFFNSLITALDDANGSTGFEEWTFVSGIAWVGYGAVVIAWVVVLPLYTMMTLDQEQAG